MAPAQANIIPINAWKAELEIAYFVGIHILKHKKIIIKSAKLCTILITE